MSHGPNWGFQPSPWQRQQRRNKLMKRLLIVAVVFLSGVIVGHVAHAGDLTLQGGFAQTPNSNYGNGSEWVARYESPIYGNLGLAAEGAYHGKTSHNHDSGTYGDLSGWTVLGGPVYHLPVSWRLKPYILGLLGWGWWSFDRSEDMENKGIEINMGDTYAWKAGIGTDYPLGGNWFLNVEYFRFGSWIPKESHYTSTGEFANVVTSDDRLGQEANCFMIGIKKKF